MKMTKKFAAVVMTGAMLTAMSVPAFASIACGTGIQTTAKNIYSVSAAAAANAARVEIEAAGIDNLSVGNPILVAPNAGDATAPEAETVVLDPVAAANAARAAFDAQGIGNAAALGYGK